MINKTRYNNSDYNAILFKPYETDFGLDVNDIVEFHLYNLNNSYILSNQSVLKNYWKTNRSVKTNVNSVYVNIHDIFNNLNITRGEFKFIFNFQRNIIGNNINKELRVARHTYHEIELISIHNQNIDWSLLKDYTDKGYFDINLNFGNNKIFQIVNIEYINDKKIYIKTYENIGTSITRNEQCWLSYELIYPYEDKILILDETINTSNKNDIYLSPNFDLNVNENISIATDLKNWNELLGTKISIADKILNNQIDGVNLNIQYNKFENFIHFSSAKERVVNFKYKLQELEQLELELIKLTQISSTIIPNNLFDIYTKRNGILNSFDGFEKFLYYNEDDSLYTHIKGSYFPWPKYPIKSKQPWEEYLENWNVTNDLPIKEGSNYSVKASVQNNLYKVSSLIGSEYFNELYTIALLYDRNNPYAIINHIPEFIKIDNENESFTLFMNMVAQFFDYIWLYIKEMENVFKLEQHPQDGIPKQLLPLIGNMFGWKLSSDLNNTDLYDYILGTDIIGNQKINNQLLSKNKLELIGELWKRIILNLPYILKTKGTKNSVKTLLACYGVPDTILKIKEFGKSSIDDNVKPMYQDESFKYGINLKNANNSYIELPWGKLKQSNKYPTAIEFRIKLDTDYDYGSGHEETILEIK